MALSIQDPEVERLARALADEEGRTVEEVVAEALRARRAWRQPPAPSGRPLSPAEVARAETEVARIQRELRALPDLDPRPGDEILYGEYGLPR